MPRLLPALSSRAEGTLLGLAVGRSLAMGAAVGGAPDGELALAWILAEELAAGPADLRRVAERWVERFQADRRGIGPETAAALSHLAQHDAPPAEGAGRSADPLVRCVPVAVAMFRSPRNLVSGTYHIAALTHPHPLVAWSAVALNVALARLLQGKRDFIADVLEALRNNPVPEELLGAVRRVPVERRQDLVTAELSLSEAVGCVKAALWLAYHEPLVDRGLRWAAEGGSGHSALAGTAGALLGARDGADALDRLPAIPVNEAEPLRQLAVVLARITPT
jgi:ADP-ribosylglycohydrolase